MTAGMALRPCLDARSCPFIYSTLNNQTDQPQNFLNWNLDPEYVLVSWLVSQLVSLLDGCFIGCFCSLEFVGKLVGLCAC